MTRMRCVTKLNGLLQYFLLNQPIGPMIVLSERIINIIILFFTEKNM